MNSNQNPFNVKLYDVTITKYSGRDKMSIMPQLVEFTLYQSIFSPLLRADMVLNDYVGLFENYPLSGEELVTLHIEQTVGNLKYTKTLHFVISGFKDISIADKARQTTYAVEMVAADNLRNANSRVSHAYNDTIENMVQQVYNQYVRQPRYSLPLKIYHTSSNRRQLVIPNLRPVDALSWLCKYAVSDQVNRYYTHMIYQDIDRYVFKPLQKLTYGNLEDDAAFLAASQNKYFYISNIDLIRNNPALQQRLKLNGVDEQRLVNDFKINKRNTNFEKFVGGYFENELVEINMLQKDYKITHSPINEQFNSLARGRLNTDLYIKDMVNMYTEKESASRVRYIVNNYAKNDQADKLFKDKFGKSARSMIAYQSVDLSVTVHANFQTQRAGDLIYVGIPEAHGFNQNLEDKYISGFFVISEAKLVLKQGGISQMMLRLNKDSYANELAAASELKLEDPNTVSALNNIAPVVRRQ